MAEDSFTKFVVLADARTGSTYLRNHLDRFPHVICHQEVFNPKCVYLNRRKHRYMYLERKLRDLFPIYFLNKTLQARPGKAVGFKILRGQNDRVFNHLIKSGDVRKIVLMRKNLLAQYTSNTLANMRKHWGPTDVNNRTGVEIDVEAYLRFAQSHRADYIKIISSLQNSGQEFLLKYYEDFLKDDVKDEFSEILEFLGAGGHARADQIQYDRLTELDFENLILNYDEVSKRLENMECGEHRSRRT